MENILSFNSEEELEKAKEILKQNTVNFREERPLCAFLRSEIDSDIVDGLIEIEEEFQKLDQSVKEEAINNTAKEMAIELSGWFDFDDMRETASIKLNNINK